VSYVTAILVTVVAAVGAGLIAYVVDRTLRLEVRRKQHEVGAQIFQLIGVLFAVMLAFVFSEVWDQYNTAAQAISSECGALHGAAMLANVLPDKIGRPVDVAIETYAQKVITTEWPVMAEQRRST
jgi:Na+/phosphate symporter